MLIGFSTGALAKGDFRRGLELTRAVGCSVIELSALRDSELKPLADALPSLDLDGFKHVSVHAPSAFHSITEAHAVDLLGAFTARNIPVVLHPDASADLCLWQSFGRLLLIENMDKRKKGGRTVGELTRVFEKLPHARLCFDIAHSRQVDPTMSQGFLILHRFRERLAQVHLSEVASNGRHTKLSIAAKLAYPRLLPLIPEQIPVIIESVLQIEEIADELSFATELWYGHRGALKKNAL